MLLLRTWAIWGRSRNILVSLSILWIVRDFYPYITLKFDFIQLCLLSGGGSTLYLALTVISESVKF